MHKAGLNGGSHYALTAILRWFTANIGVRHVRHLSSCHFRGSLQGNDLTFLQFSGHWIKRLGALPVRG